MPRNKDFIRPGGSPFHPPRGTTLPYPWAPPGGGRGPANPPTLKKPTNPRNPALPFPQRQRGWGIAMLRPIRSFQKYVSQKCEAIPLAFPAFTFSTPWAFSVPMMEWRKRRTVMNWMWYPIWMNGVPHLHVSSMSDAAHPRHLFGRTPTSFPRQHVYFASCCFLVVKKLEKDYIKKRSCECQEEVESTITKKKTKRKGNKDGCFNSRSRSHLPSPPQKSQTSQ